MERVSVILPTWNEREHILPLIEAVHKELRDSPYEILVVDDQSIDGTAQAAAQARDPAVRVLVRSEDHGYAKSIRHGIEQASGDILIIMDSDFNHDPACIPQMLGLLSGHDGVSASRFLKGGKMTPVWRGVCSGIFNLFIRGVTGGRMTDNLYGFFALRRRVLAGCPFDDIFFGFGDYGMRLLFCLQKNHAKILEFPAVCASRPVPRRNRRLVRIFCRYFVETLKLAGKGRIQ